MRSACRASLESRDPDMGNLLLGVTPALARKLAAEGITVNGIIPGPFGTI